MTSDEMTVTNFVHTQIVENKKHYFLSPSFIAEHGNTLCLVEILSSPGPLTAVNLLQKDPTDVREFSTSHFPSPP